MLGNNMFAYCGNNPVIQSDHTGHFPGIIALVKNIVSALESAFVVKYNVPLYDQGDYRLCWAFCQVMVEDYQSGNVRSQQEAVARARALAIAVNGERNADGKEIWNRGAWPTNCLEYNEKGVPIPVSGLDNIFELYLYIKNNGPVYAYYSFNAQNPKDSRAHLVVVTGVNLFQCTVYTNNPHGIAREQTYVEFLNGYAGGVSDGSYPYRWCYPCR